MKKVTLLLLALLLVAGTSVFAEGSSESSGTGALPELEITTLYHFDNGDPTQFPELKAEWKEWYADYFGVDYKINFFPRPEYMQKFTLAMSSNEIKGIAQIFGGSYMDDFYNDGATVDILPMIKDNGNWTRLEDGMKEANIREGALLAFPSAWSPGSFFVRSIRKDWLDNLGLDMPETIDELYTAVKMMTENDPDGNGKDDTVGMTSSGVWNMQDIFHSFGVPTNHVGAHLITPDPHDGMRYNDGFLKPQIVDALTWLADVYENGYMDQEIWTNGGSQMRERMQSGYAGSTYYWQTWVFSFENGAKKVDPNADIEPILGLSSPFADKYTNLGALHGSGAPYPLLAGTKNAKEQANLFLDIHYGDDVGHFSGWFGVYQKYWEFGPNGEVVRIPMEYKEDGTPTFARGPNIISGNMLPFFNLGERGYKLIDNPAAGDNYVRQQKAYADWRVEANEKDIFFAYKDIEKEPQSDHFRNIVADVQRIFEESVTKAMTGQLSPEEAVESYKSQMKSLNAQKALDEANAYLGRTSSTVYRY